MKPSTTYLTQCKLLEAKGYEMFDHMPCDETTVYKNFSTGHTMSIKYNGHVTEGNILENKYDN